MKNENLIHIKLEYNEAIVSKRDILSSQASLLRIARIIKQYKMLRLKELNLKLRLAKKINSVKKNLIKLKKVLPKIEIPDIIERKEEISEQHQDYQKIEMMKSPYDDAIESELKTIQKKLKSLKG